MSRIEKLTPEQIARFPEYVDRWMKIGLCTDPADRPRAEAAINEAYRCAGLVAPSRIVWCGSPLSQGLTRTIILDKKMMRDVGDSVWDSVWDSVGASVWASVWASVGDSVGASVRASVWDSVRASVWDSVWDSVGASVRASVGASVRASVGDSVRASVWDSVRASVWDSVGASVWDSGYGQHDAGWLSFYAYMREVVGLTYQTERLLGLANQAQSAGWFLPHAKICWVSERHNILRRDERGRLHDLSGPACAYPDGLAIYAVHGVRVPEYVILRPQEITPANIDAEGNAEVRRVMLDRYGIERYMRDTQAQVVATVGEDHTMIGLRGARLIRRDLPADEPIVMVDCVNSSPEPDGTHRRYMLRVDPNAYNGAASRDVLAAMASTWRNADGSLLFARPDQYRPECET